MFGRVPPSLAVEVFTLKFLSTENSTSGLYECIKIISLPCTFCSHLGVRKKNTKVVKLIDFELIRQISGATKISRWGKPFFSYCCIEKLKP